MTCLIAGPTSCGKSSFIFRLLKNRVHMFDTQFTQIIYSLPPNQDIFLPDEIKNDKQILFHEGIPSFEEFKDRKPRLLIIDDQARDCNQEISDLFTRGSHHFNISVILLAQNIFTSNPYFRTISLNSHYLIIFKNPRAFDQISVLARQISPNNTKFFLEAYEESCREPHTYLLLDMTQSCPDDLRLRTNIFPDDPDSTTVFVPIKK